MGLAGGLKSGLPVAFYPLLTVGLRGVLAASLTVVLTGYKLPSNGNLIGPGIISARTSASHRFNLLTPGDLKVVTLSKLPTNKLASLLG